MACVHADPVWEDGEGLRALTAGPVDETREVMVYTRDGRVEIDTTGAGEWHAPDRLGAEELDAPGQRRQRPESRRDHDRDRQRAGAK